MIRVMLIDDNIFMRRMLKQLIEMEKDVCVSAEAKNSAEALQILSGEDFDALLVDISLEGADTGIQLIQRIRTELKKSVPILSVSLHDESVYADRLRDAGAQGYLSKEDAAEQVIPAIRRLVAGERFWSGARAA